MGSEGGGKRTLMAILEAWVERARERIAERRALATPKAAPESRLARSRLGAALDVRLAVRAGVRLDDFLRSRLAKYAATLPVTLEDLPVDIDIEGGEAIVRLKAASRPAAPRGATAAPEAARALVDREGPWAAREIRDAEAALDALDARAAAARARIDELSHAFGAALASGKLAARADLDATAEQLGRPPVPPAAPVGALRGFVGALLAAEAWQLSGPVLAASGMSPRDVEQALHAAPVPAGLALVFAAGAAAAVFAFAAVALSRAADALEDVPSPRRRPALALGAVLAGIGAGGVAAVAAAPRPWTHVLLLVTVPFAGAILWRWASHLARIRAAAVDAALAWDRDRAREALDRGRYAEAIGSAEAELRTVEAERLSARRRARVAQRRAVDAERRHAATARAEARRLERLAEGLASALEQDRYLFLRLSAERTDAALARRSGRLEPIASERLGVAG